MTAAALCPSCQRPLTLPHASFAAGAGADYHGEIQTADWREVGAVTVYVPWYGRFMVARRDLLITTDHHGQPYTFPGRELSAGGFHARDPRAEQD